MLNPEHDARHTSLQLVNGCFVLSCGTCGWRSNPVRAVGLEAAWDGHVAASTGFWPAAPSTRADRTLSLV